MAGDTNYHSDEAGGGASDDDDDDDDYCVSFTQMDLKWVVGV